MSPGRGLEPSLAGPLGIWAWGQPREPGIRGAGWPRCHHRERRAPGCLQQAQGQLPLSCMWSSEGKQLGGCAFRGSRAPSFHAHTGGRVTAGALDPRWPGSPEPRTRGYLAAASLHLRGHPLGGHPQPTCLTRPAPAGPTPAGSEVSLQGPSSQVPCQGLRGVV